MKTDIISKEWTTRELRAYIREETQSANYRLLEYYADTPADQISPIIAQAKERLVALGTGKPVGEAEAIGLGLTYKTKAELLQQARALHEFSQVDLYTPEGVRKYSEKEELAYNTFINNRPALSSMSIDEYHDLVEAFGSLGAHVLEEFGYEEMAAIYHSAKSTKKLDLVQAVKDVQREAKNEGKDITIDQQYLIDHLVEKMKE